MRWLLSILLVAGCASSGVNRHASAPVARTPYAFDGVYLHRTRGGQLSASREWERPTARPAALADAAALGAAFRRDLSRTVTLDDAAPVHIRSTLTMQDTGYFEGLASETADLTLFVELTDGHGNTLRTITMRESASAPLQRSASRQLRLQAAMTRLANRLAAQL